MTRWFYKTTEPIPVKINIPLASICNVDYNIAYVSGGVDSDNGHVYINYNSHSWWNPFFWEGHFHEFLHRIFWVLKWDRMHKVIDFINHAIFLASIKKRIIKKHHNL
jgi:hypothetical protein